jgi:hypothetical protein
LPSRPTGYGGSPTTGPISSAYDNDLPAIRALYRDLGFDVHHSRLIGVIQHSFMLTPRTLTYLAIGWLVTL